MKCFSVLHEMTIMFSVSIMNLIYGVILNTKFQNFFSVIMFVCFHLGGGSLLGMCLK